MLITSLSEKKKKREKKRVKREGGCSTIDLMLLSDKKNPDHNSFL